MDFDIERPPEWSFQWCYFFAGMGIFTLLTGFAALFVGKRLSLGLMMIFLFSVLVQAATSLTLFWMCRTSLNPGSRSAGCGKSPWYGVQ